MARWAEMVEDDDDDEYAKLVRRMNPPRVVIDNDACDNATVIRVDRVKKHGILLEAVQVLVDLNLVITKAYISSDGNWFMDVFNVTDQDGSKLQNREVIDHIQKCLESDGYLPPPANGGFVPPEDQFTSIELTGADRPGLLSEVCAVLAALSCNIVKAEVWTHDRRAAAVIQITDEATGLAIHDVGRLSRAQELLSNLMQSDGRCNRGATGVSVGTARTERRLHKMMLDDRVGGGEEAVGGGEERGGCGKARHKAAKVVVMDCTERQYTVVILRCRDRPKLLFDTLCALNDLQYVVFHGTVDAEGASKEAYQEYYIRHVDGHPVRADAERTRLVRCLEAAVERRASNGLELELEVRTEDRVGLLSEITRVFRENSLSIIRAAITTKDGKAEDTFYVSDTYGNPVDGRTIDAVGEQLGHAVLRVKRRGHDASVKHEAEGGAVSVLGSLLKGSFQGLRLIRSYS
ncbi:ACT domain-containing protein ACR6 isoform X2 [Sorghum bicolor]|uniref:ACT domain-containing protein ACR n=1 Tax=Sorghum bicolor TaxID=4558 RepID=C5YHR4_SORBI|nr:ACT domain-containing protein ACR6 isoform X2 [Sorghum bicolor]EES15301.1 hypothetical protein SORBI_3007G191900 [Sorghum bicolor]|eukprot:XP_002445806.1 ACT domain-containing protein ACR6 isoform X2 [Sorghum bicolor]